LYGNLISYLSMVFLCDPDDNDNGDDDDVDNGDDVIVHTTHAVSDTAYHDTF